MKHRVVFSKVQVYPTSFDEVVDEPEAKPVILSPAHSHRIVMSCDYVRPYHGARPSSPASWCW